MKLMWSAIRPSSVRLNFADLETLDVVDGGLHLFDKTLLPPATGPPSLIPRLYLTDFERQRRDAVL